MLKNARIELFIGLSIGILLMFSLYFFAQAIQKKSVNNYPLKEIVEKQISDSDLVFSEKVKGLNDRMGDLYLSFTIIITLLLGIVAGVYFKTETEVSKHMNKNFSIHRQEIENINAEAQKILSELKSKADLAEQILPRRETANQQKQTAE